MATIALYSSEIKKMPGLINDFKKTVTNYKLELTKLKSKTLTVNQSVCDLSDVISSIQSSTQTQEEKVTSLERLNQSIEEFVSNSAGIDSDVADLVDQRKDDFYKKYDYLKPNSEKGIFEQIGDALSSAAEWCMDRLKDIGEFLLEAGKAILKFLTIAGKLVIGAFLVLVGLFNVLISIPKALIMMGGGARMQLGFSTMMYGAFMFGSVFDSQMQADMDAIGWNPFNSDVSLLTGPSNGRKVSFYKGMPVIWSNQSNGRSGSFLGIWLTGDNSAETINHEWGHGVQQIILGPLKYLLMIGLPSFQQWGPPPSERNYYNRPWEITADIFGGVGSRNTTPIRTQDDINRGWAYLFTSKFFGFLGYAIAPF